MSKTAIVTGASRGIGRAIALKLAEEGWCVAVNYHSSQKEAEELVSLIGRGASIAVCADVSQKAEACRLVREAKDRFGFVDLLVNNAGISDYSLFQDISEERWRQMFAVNVDGAFFCTQAVIPDMISRRRGCVINISSVWGQTGAAAEVCYSAAKSALIGMTKALAKEVGPSGVRVNCVAPAATVTDMLRRFTTEELEDIRSDSALLQLARPEDVAETVAFLASPAASMYTGQVLCPNGGALI